MTLPLMPKATAVWLVDNTKLTFVQIAAFVGMHELEIAGIADDEVAVGIKGMNPIDNNQLTRAEIEHCENDPTARLALLVKVLAPEAKRKGPRYTPLSKRQDRPSAIAWLVRYHPELTDSQIMKLVGTTKPTIESVRSKSHWNIQNITPVDPVALGMCKQIELDEAVRKAAEKTGKTTPDAVMTNEERMNLLSTDESLAASAASSLPKGFEGLENFSLSSSEREPEAPKVDADSLFNLPKRAADDEEEENP